MRNPDLLFERTNGEIRTAHLRSHQHHDLIIAGDRCEIGGISRLYAATEFTPKIELPRSTDTNIELRKA